MELTKLANDVGKYIIQITQERDALKEQVRILTQERDAPRMKEFLMMRLDELGFDSKAIMNVLSDTNYPVFLTGDIIYEAITGHRIDKSDPYVVVVLCPVWVEEKIEMLLEKAGSANELIFVNGFGHKDDPNTLSIHQIFFELNRLYRSDISSNYYMFLQNYFDGVNFVTFCDEGVLGKYHIFPKGTDTDGDQYEISQYRKCGFRFFFETSGELPEFTGRTFTNSRCEGTVVSCDFSLPKYQEIFFAENSSEIIEEFEVSEFEVSEVITHTNSAGIFLKNRLNELGFNYALFDLIYDRNYPVMIGEIITDSLYGLRIDRDVTTITIIATFDKFTSMENALLTHNFKFEKCHVEFHRNFYIKGNLRIIVVSSSLPHTTADNIAKQHPFSFCRTYFDLSFRTLDYLSTLDRIHRFGYCETIPEEYLEEKMRYEKYGFQFLNLEKEESYSYLFPFGQSFL